MLKTKSLYDYLEEAKRLLPNATEDERMAWAMDCVSTHPGHHKNPHGAPPPHKKRPSTLEVLRTIIQFGILLLLLFAAVRGHAQTGGSGNGNRGGSIIKFQQAGVPVGNLVTPFTVNFQSGCTVTKPSAAVIQLDCAGGGGGGVTNVSSGNLAPLFTVAVANPATTPAFTFTLSNAAAHTVFGNNTGAGAAPAYFVPAFTDLSGSLSCGQHPALTGDITTPAGSCATTYANIIGTTKGGFGIDTSGIAKGGIVTGSAANTFLILAVGANGTVLTADSTAANGVKWAASSGSGCPITTKGDICAYDTAASRLPVGRDRYSVVADASQAIGLNYKPVGRPLYRIARCLACATGNNRVTVMDSEVTTAGTLTSIAASVGNAPMINCATTTTVNTTCLDSDNAVYARQMAPDFETIHAFPAAADWAATRVFYGLSDQTAATMGNSDVPAGNFMGFMASTTGTYTGLSDTTNWVCIQKDGATENAVTTGVAFGATTQHTMEAYANEQTGAIEYYIDGAAVCGSMTANRPTSTTLMRQMGSLQNLTAGTARNIRWSFLWTEAAPF